MISQDELLDLRRAVLRGEQLSVADAQRVFEAMRSDVGAIPTESIKRSPRSKKPVMTDEALDSSLDDLLKL